MNTIPFINVLGFRIKLDASILWGSAILIWTLAQGALPFYYQEYANVLYWIMSISITILLVLSLLIHEIVRIMLERHFSWDTRDRFLYFFGACKYVDKEPKPYFEELIVFFSGSLCYFLLGVLFHFIATAGKKINAPILLIGTSEFLKMLNLMIFTINLIPAYPLDAGRLLIPFARTIKLNTEYAAKTAAYLGTLLGMVLFASGLLFILKGTLAGGIWWMLFGYSLQHGARRSLSCFEFRDFLEGESIDQYMTSDIVKVPPWISIYRFIYEFVFRFNYQIYPLQERMLGNCRFLTANQAVSLPRYEWDRFAVSEIGTTNADYIVDGKEDVANVLSLMHKNGKSRMMVFKNGEIVGIVTLQDLLSFFASKLCIPVKS